MPRPNLSTEECAVIARDLVRHPKVKSVIQRYTPGGNPVVLVKMKGGAFRTIVTDQDYQDMVRSLNEE